MKYKLWIQHKSEWNDLGEYSELSKARGAVIKWLEENEEVLIYSVVIEKV